MISTALGQAPAPRVVQPQEVWEGGGGAPGGRGARHAEEPLRGEEPEHGGDAVA